MNEKKWASPLSTRICDGFTYGFAAWTVLANVTVLLGGTLQQLIIAAAVTAAAAVLAIGLSHWARERGDGREPPPPLASMPRETPRPQWLTAAALAGALLITGLYAVSGNLVLFWWCAVAYLLLLALREASALRALGGHDDQQETRDRPERSWEWLLFMTAAACTVVTLCAHRVEYDDVFYLNMAVSAVDHPAQPLLALDGLHGIPSLPLLIAIYRVHAIELFGAALAYISGRPVLDPAHLVIPALAAFLVPLALARAYRLIVPGRWIWAVLTVVGIFCFAGETHQWYSNFAFVRLQQGKAIFLCLSVPLIISYALEFAAQPTRLRWVRLACAQIAAIGLSSTALLVAPAVAGLALAAGASYSWKSARMLVVARTLVIGLAASAYGLVLAAMLMSETRATMDLLPGVEHPNAFSGAVAMVLGDAKLQYATLLAVLATWAVAGSTTLRRIGVIFPLGFFLLLLNPYTADWIAGNWMSNLTYWRVFWVLPVPLLLGAVLTAPLEAFPKTLPRWIGTAVCLTLVAAFLFWAPAVATLTRANRVEFRTPSWKVPEEAFAAARAMVRHAPPNHFALAPYQVAHWVPTQHHHPPLIAVRRHYLKLLDPLLQSEKIGPRLQLFELMSASRPITRAGAVLRSMAQFPIGVVCLDRLAGVANSFGKLLSANGFERVETSVRYEVWALPSGRINPQK